MGFKKFIETFKNKRWLKIAFELILSSISVILFLSILFLILIVVLSNYKTLVASFGITVNDDCKFQGQQIECSFVEIKDKDFSIKLNQISGKINIKNLFTGQPMIGLKIKNLDGTYTNDLTAPPSDRIKGLFETYMALSYIHIFVDDMSFKVLNLDEDTNLLITSKSIRNIKNTIITDSLDITVEKQKDTFNIKLKNPDDTKLFVYPDSIKFINSIFEYDRFKFKITDGFITEKKSIELRGKTDIEAFKKDNLIFSGIYSDFFINYIPSKKLSAKLTGYIKNTTFESYTELKKSKFNLSLTGKDISEFNSKGKIEIEDSFVKDIRFGKLDINLNITNKNQKLSLDGYLNSEIAKIKFGLKDDTLSLETDRLEISKLDRLHKFSENFKKLDGNLKVSMNVDLNRWSASGKVNVWQFYILDFKDINGDLTFSYSKSDDILDIKSFLSDKYAKFHLYGTIKKITEKPTANLKFSLDNFKLETISELRDLSITGEGNFSGDVYGSIDDYYLRLSGNAKKFSFEEINLYGLELNLNYKSKDNILNIKSNLPDKTLLADISVNIGKDLTSLNFKLDKFKTDSVLAYLKKHSNIFENIKPIIASGDIGLDIRKEDFRLNLSLPVVDISVENSTPIRASVNGYITKNSKELLIDGFADALSIKGYKISNLSFKSHVKNNNVDYSGKFKYEHDKLNFDTSISGIYDIESQNLSFMLKTDGKFDINNNPRNLSLNIQTSGNIENLQGIGKLNIDKSTLNFDLKVSAKDKLNVVVNTQDFLYSMDGYKFTLGKSISMFEIDNNTRQLKGVIKISNIYLSGKAYNLLYVKELSINLDKDKVYVPQVFFTGVLSGKIESLYYNLEDENIKVNISGDIDKKYVSEISQFLNLDGNLRFSFSYAGKFENITKDYNLMIFGDNLKLRTAYTQNIVNFKKFQIKAKDTINFDIFGTTKSSAGEGFIKLYGDSKADLSQLGIDIESTKIPVKYGNQFSGLVDGNMKISLFDKKLTFDSQASITGRLKLEPSMLEEAQQKNGNDKPEILKKAKLNIKISTSSPLFIEGSWGKSYADIDVSITGTVENPIINGKITVAYGKVVVMRNIYNIDFLNIKITNNVVYVNGRLSTYVSGVNIFVNVSGPSNNLKYDFFSTPPKSKDEILTLLLLKKTPEQIASSEIFSIIGKFGQMLIPFKVEEEEKGLFGTGVNINIIPTYSPVQGIVFSVYMQKYLTRRIYIGLSRPLSQYQLTNYVGWYEGGIRLTEKTSFVIKSFENKSKSAEITFTIPFDF